MSRESRRLRRKILESGIKAIALTCYNDGFKDGITSVLSVLSNKDMTDEERSIKINTLVDSFSKDNESLKNYNK